MMKQNDDFAGYAQGLAEKYGRVTYNTVGMYAPGDYAAGASLFVSKEEFRQARTLAKAKLDYLLSTARPGAGDNPNSFLDLRDGGTDTRGQAGQPLMTGWLDYARQTLALDRFLADLQSCGERIAEDFGALVVIGIGGSYTHIEGMINACNPRGTRIPFFFLGQHLSAEAYERIFARLALIKKKIAVNVISKSGTTTEPALALRLLLDRLGDMKKLGAVFATTDPLKGALRETISERGFNPQTYFNAEINKHFYIRADIGGRFSVITPVGLLAFAVAGMDLKEVLAGHLYAMEFRKETAVEAAALKFAAYRHGAVNALLSYNVACFREQILGFRQLWPECNGKDGKGLNVMEEFYTADAHSNGQLIRSGLKNMMEIFHFLGDIGADFAIPDSPYNNDKLDTVAKSSKTALSLHKINNRFMAALLLDHWQAGVPVMAVNIPSLNPFLVAMHMGVEHYSAVLFGLLLGINPVNQPGVQGYKEIAFKLLGMKGDDALKKSLRELEELGI